MRRGKVFSIDISGIDEVLKKHNGLLKKQTKMNNLIYKRLNRSIKRSLHREVKNKGYAIDYADFEKTVSLYTKDKNLELSSRSRRLSITEDRIKLSKAKRPRISVKIKKQPKSFERRKDFFLMSLRGRRFVVTRRYYSTNQKLVKNNYTNTIAGTAGRSDKRFVKGRYSKYKLTSRQVLGREKVTPLKSISIGNEFRETFLNSPEGQKKIIRIVEDAAFKVLEGQINKLNAKKPVKK